MTHLNEEDLILLFYNEREVSPEVSHEVSMQERSHLAECSECRNALAELSATLRLADDYPVPEPPADFERTVWARLAPALPTRKSRWEWRAWILVPAIAALLLGVFYLGKASLPTQKPIVAGLSKQARERILVISLADHLERTGLLLTDLSNVSDTDAPMPFDRERARDLVNEGRLMQQSLELTGDRNSEELLAELERLLVEVANAPDKVTPAAVREWQSRIGSGSLLFKVRVVESNLRTKGQRL